LGLLKVARFRDHLAINYPIESVMTNIAKDSIFGSVAPAPSHPGSDHSISVGSGDVSAAVGLGNGASDGMPHAPSLALLFALLELCLVGFTANGGGKGSSPSDGLGSRYRTLVQGVRPAVEGQTLRSGVNSLAQIVTGAGSHSGYAPFHRLSHG
jgi:hypothetical protein